MAMYIRHNLYKQLGAIFNIYELVYFIYMKQGIHNVMLTIVINVNDSFIQLLQAKWATEP